MRNPFSRKLHNLTLRGSLICVSLMLILMPQTALAASAEEMMADIAPPASADIDSAKSGIVRIVAGVETDDGKFERKAVASGFIVSNDGPSAYIVTALHAVDFGEDTKIQIIIKNDSAVEASLDDSNINREKDFCILTAENKFNDKTALPMRIARYDAEGEELAAGDEVTALGFSAGLGSSSEFSASDVSSSGGKLGKTDGENSGYLEFDAQIEDGLDGGALVDSEGYVVGLVNAKKGGEGSSSALDIADVESLLYKSGLPYRTKDKDELYSELYDLCLNADRDYEKAGKKKKAALSAAWRTGYDVLSDDPYNREALASAIDGYKKAAGKKAKPPVILMSALGAVMIALAVRLITLVRWNRKNDPSRRAAGKKEKRRKEKKRKAAPEPVRGPALIILRTGEERMLDPYGLTIGKSPEADLTIYGNAKVSRMHAALACKNGAYFIYDTGSTNGTFVNGMPVGPGGARLVPGDRIRLADEELEFIG